MLFASYTFLISLLFFYLNKKKLDITITFYLIIIVTGIILLVHEIGKSNTRFFLIESNFKKAQDEQFLAQKERDEAKIRYSELNKSATLLIQYGESQILQINRLLEENEYLRTELKSQKKLNEDYQYRMPEYFKYNLTMGLENNFTQEQKDLLNSKTTEFYDINSVVYDWFFSEAKHIKVDARVSDKNQRKLYMLSKFHTNEIDNFEEQMDLRFTTKEEYIQIATDSKLNQITIDLWGYKLDRIYNYGSLISLKQLCGLDLNVDCSFDSPNPNLSNEFLKIYYFQLQTPDGMKLLIRNKNPQGSNKSEFKFGIPNCINQ